MWQDLWTCVMWRIDECDNTCTYTNHLWVMSRGESYRAVYEEVEKQRLICKMSLEHAWCDSLTSVATHIYTPIRDSLTSVTTHIYKPIRYEICHTQCRKELYTGYSIDMRGVIHWQVWPHIYMYTNNSRCDHTYTCTPIIHELCHA